MAKLVGHMRNKNGNRSGGSHPELEIFGPFALDHWFRTEFERHSEKGLFVIFLGMQELRYSQGVGFGFTYGSDPIAMCVEIRY